MPYAHFTPTPILRRGKLRPKVRDLSVVTQSAADPGL